MGLDLKFATRLVFFGDSPKPGSDPTESLRQKIEAASKVKGLSGLEMHFPYHFDGVAVNALRDILKQCQLKVSCLNIRYDEARWKMGIFTNADKALREEAIERGVRAVDLAKNLECEYVSLVLGQDGSDYPFQANYNWLWLTELKGIRKIAEHDSQIKVCLEYKLKGPRMHVVLDTVSKTLLAIREIGLPNVGITMDFAHAWMASENLSESLALISRYGQLFNIHVNDSYGTGDDHLVPGIIHALEIMELLYYLQEINYQGWITFDVAMTPQNAIKVCELCIQNLIDLHRIVQEIDKSFLLKIQERMDALSAQELIRLAVSKG